MRDHVQFGESDARSASERGRGNGAGNGDGAAHHDPALLADILRALECDELRLYYQPRVDLQDGRVLAVVALLRWQHAERGLLAPGDFLHLLSRPDLETDLDRWVLRTALEQGRQWRDAGLSLSISVNLSARFLLEDDAVASLRAQLAAAQLDRSAPLEVQLLGTGEVEDRARLAERVADCRDMGVKVAVHGLDRDRAANAEPVLPVDLLKLDLDTVRRMLEHAAPHASVARALEDAAAQRLPAVAEGVEVAEIAFLLHRLGCRLAQGYGIARPMPAYELGGWLEHWRADNVCVDVQRWCRAHEPGGDSALDVAVFSHDRWYAALRSRIAGETSSQDLTLDATLCPVSTWLAGLGRERFGDRDGFAGLAAQHTALHEHARSLFLALPAGSPDTAARAIAELQDLGRGFDTELAALGDGG